MKNSISSASASTETTTRKTPRLVSLQHRLEHAKDAEGKPLELADELLFLLDDPPDNITDRWQAGADLCARHGIQTSRMAVWRFYRATIFQWRRKNNPPPPLDDIQIDDLHRQGNMLLALRVVEMLSDPNLKPGHLIALLQNENQRQKHELAQEQFTNQMLEREYERRRAIEKEKEDRIHGEKAGKAFLHAMGLPDPGIHFQSPTAPPTPSSIPPHTTS